MKIYFILLSMVTCAVGAQVGSPGDTELDTGIGLIPPGSVPNSVTRQKTVLVGLTLHSSNANCMTKRSGTIIGKTLRQDGFSVWCPVQLAVEVCICSVHFNEIISCCFRPTDNSEKYRR